MTWQEETVKIELVDEDGNHITDIDMKKDEMVSISILAGQDGVTVEEKFLELLTKGLEDETTED